MSESRYWWFVLGFPFLAFIAFPILALFVRTSLDKLVEKLGEPQVLQAVLLSFETTAIATVVTIIFGTPVAYLLARGRMPFRQLLDTLIDLPSVLPPAVAGVALLMAFGRRGILGAMLTDLGIHLAFTETAVVLAQTFISAPFYIKSATLGFANIDDELIQAAALDGANSWEIFRYVTIPLSQSALLSGSVMTWARALGEFGATIIFAGNLPGRTQTMPLAIYLGFELDLDAALALSVILVGCSFLALLLVKGVLDRRNNR